MLVQNHSDNVYWDKVRKITIHGEEILSEIIAISIYFSKASFKGDAGIVIDLAPIYKEISNFKSIQQK